MITEIAEERRLPESAGVHVKEMPEEEAPPRAKREPKAKAPAKAAAKGRPARDLWPVAARALLIAGAFMLVIFVWHQIDQFFIADPRFVLVAANENGDPSGLRIEGIKHTTRAQVESVFRNDFGRSVYLTELAERRRMMLGLSWVKDASVSRAWPNHLVVRVTERKPFANVLLGIPNEGEEGTNVALVDEEGIILQPLASPKVDLPVLRGLSLVMPDKERKLRVARAQRMLREAAELADSISEIDVTDAENLKITRPVGERAFTLYLGHDQYRARLEHFYRVVDQIRKRYPNQTVFDLRTKDIMAYGVKGE